MKSFVTALLVMLSAAGASRADVTGAWTAVQYDDPSREFQFNMDLDRDGYVGRGYRVTDFIGLTAEQVSSSSKVPVAFEMRREAGTVRFEGTFRNGRGSGDFTFAPDYSFARRLRDVGVDWDGDRGDEAMRLFTLATNDLTIDFIRSMQAIGYDESLEQYVAFRIFKVDPAYVKAMNDAGFRRLSATKLVETKIHGVTPEYIREMRAQGEDLSIDEYVQSRIFQVTPEFAEEMKKLGYASLGRDQLVAFRIHNVTPEFVTELKELGYNKVSADNLIAMRIHGVTPQFIRRADAAAGRKVPVDRLIEMRIFNIDPEDAEI